MTRQPRYVLDADSFIRSKREHDAFDFCPAYWDLLLRGFSSGRLFSIAPIRAELLRGNDALAEWVRNQVPDEFFEPVEDPAVQAAYANAMTWADRHPQYSRAAKQSFARGADPWLIASAAALGSRLVTYEVSQPDSKSKIKMPDAAKQFSVRCIPPYVMLRELGVRFELRR